jgi:hypothetical protein
MRVCHGHCTTWCVMLLLMFEVAATQGLEQVTLTPLIGRQACQHGITAHKLWCVHK